MSFDIAALNLLDYIILVVLVISAVLSTLRGMTRETLGLIGWPIAIFAAKYSAPVIEPFISDIIPVEGIGQALSWALPFAVTVVIWFAIASILSPGLKRAGLGALDRWLGVFFGLIRGYVIVLLTYVVAVVVMEGEDNLPKQVAEATFNPYIRASVISLSAVAPEDLEERILDNVPANPKTDMPDVKTTVDDLSESTTQALEAAQDAGNETDEQFELLKDEVQSE